MAKKHKKKSLGPVVFIIYSAIFVLFLNLILSIIGYEGNLAYINNGNLETSLVTIKSLFSKDGFKFLISNVNNNFKLYEPLTVLIISLIGIGIGEKSGFLKALFSPFKTWKTHSIIFLTVFVGIIFSFFGEASYAFLIPLAGVFYKYASKNSRLGIITMFIALSSGYGVSLFATYEDYLLGLATEASARVDVDSLYSFSLLSNVYMSIACTFVLTFVETMIIEKFLVTKYSKKTPELEDEVEISKDALGSSLIVMCIFLFVIIMGIIPGPFLLGFLLDSNETSYIASLLGNNSPFGQSIIFILSLLLMVCGYVYGNQAGTIKSSNDYSLGLSKGFGSAGYVFVLMFFTSQLISMIDWSNFGEVIGANMVSFLGSVPFSGIPLIVIFFFIVLGLSIVVPGTLEKWNILSPMVIPLFMRSNITPSFVQFIFRVSDGLGKCISPIFPYFIVALGFMQKYNYDENREITFTNLLKEIMPVFLILVGLWLLILIGWYTVGIPTGVHVYPTL